VPVRAGQAQGQPVLGFVVWFCSFALCAFSWVSLFGVPGCALLNPGYLVLVVFFLFQHLWYCWFSFVVWCRLRAGQAQDLPVLELCCLVLCVSALRF